MLRNIEDNSISLLNAVTDIAFINNAKCSGSIEHLDIKPAPLAHLLYLTDSPSVLVLTFHSDNPVRQIVATWELSPL